MSERERRRRVFDGAINERTNIMLTPGELSKGMFITVFENKSIENEKFNLFGDVAVKTKNADYSGCGAILKVLALQLPYVIVRYVDDKFMPPTTFDTRRTTFMELSPEFIAAKSMKL